MAALQIESWRHAYNGIIANSTLEAMDFSRFAIQWQRGLDHGMTALVASAADDAAVPESMPDAAVAIFGFAILEGEEISMLYVAPAYWRQGIGRQLLQAALHRLRAAGKLRAWLWVLRDNARGQAFYRALGGRLEDESDVKVGEQILRQVRYVWPFEA